MATAKEIFYSVQPGDSLSQIIARSGVLLPADRKKGLARLLELNPHIKNANVIHPGDLIRIGSTEGNLDTPTSGDMDKTRKVWQNLDKGTREIIQKNFDVLEWMSRQKDKLDFLENVNLQGKPLYEAVPELNYGVIPAEYRRFRLALDELTIIRGNTVSTLQRLRISVVRQPIFILTATSNGLYKYAQTLLKMVEWAKKVKLGRNLLFFEVEVEATKVGVTAAVTRNKQETLNQAYRGAVKVASGLATTIVTKKICSITVKRGPRGWLACGVAVGAGIWGGQYVTGKLSDIFLGKPIDAQLRELP